MKDTLPTYVEFHRDFQIYSRGDVAKVWRTSPGMISIERPFHGKNEEASIVLAANCRTIDKKEYDKAMTDHLIALKSRSRTGAALRLVLKGRSEVGETNYLICGERLDVVAVLSEKGQEAIRSTDPVLFKKFMSDKINEYIHGH